MWLVKTTYVCYLLMVVSWLVVLLAEPGQITQVIDVAKDASFCVILVIAKEIFWPTQKIHKGKGNETTGFSGLNVSS